MSDAISTIGSAAVSTIGTVAVVGMAGKVIGKTVGGMNRTSTRRRGTSTRRSSGRSKHHYNKLLG